MIDLRAEALLDIPRKSDLNKRISELLYFLSRPMPKAAVPEYSEALIERILDWSSDMEDVGQFKALERIHQSLLDNQPELYREVAEYITTHAIHATLHRRDKEKTEKLYRYFIAHPFDNFDYTNLVTVELACFGYTDILKPMYRFLSTTDKEPVKYHRDSPEALCDHLETVIAIESLSIPISEIEEQWLLELRKEMLEKKIANISEIGEHQQQGTLQPHDSMTVLRYEWREYYREHGIATYVAERAWEVLLTVWQDINVEKGNPAFALPAKGLKETLTDDLWMSVNDISLKGFVIWAIPYAYDYLKDQELIAEAVYDEAIAVVRQIKSEVLHRRKDDLWQFDGVHDWQPPAHYTTEEWESEKRAFKASVTSNKNNIYEGNYDMYAPEESAIKKHEEMQNFIENFSKQQKSISQAAESKETLQYSTRDLSTIGRNEKVTVEYDDGTIKRDIKFKKVQRDLENKRCSLMKS